MKRRDPGVTYICAGSLLEQEKESELKGGEGTVSRFNAEDSVACKRRSIHSRRPQPK